MEGEDVNEGEDSRRKKKKTPGEVRVDLSFCKYEILRIVIRKLGWEEASPEDKSWHVCWTDTSIGPDRLLALKRGQKINHFFGMLQICRKKSLARHISNMRKMFPAEYKFFPRAFVLPNQIPELIPRLNNPQRLRTYILKPDSGCQGRGVVLVQNVSDLKQALGGIGGANLLAQKYLTNPLLLNGYKFDLRIYVLVLSCDPLRLFLYREGLARFCTEKYMKPERGNLKVNCMHLTNYAVNKFNAKFEVSSSMSDTGSGSKWTLSSLYKALASRGYDTVKLKKQIKKMVVMTILSIVPLLVYNSKTCLNEDDTGRTCFELLGMDVLLDDKCKPWLLEVNHSPSFSIETPLDFKVKEALISDTLRLIQVDPLEILKFKMQDKRGAKMRLYGSKPIETYCSESTTIESNDLKQDSLKIMQEQEEYEIANMGNYDRIYPAEDENLQKLYETFLEGSHKAFTQSFDMKVRNAIAKAQEEKRKEEMEREAAEQKKIRLKAEMRRKAQETAKVAISSQPKYVSSSEENQEIGADCTDIATVSKGDAAEDMNQAYATDQKSFGTSTISRDFESKYGPDNRAETAGFGNDAGFIISESGTNGKLEIRNTGIFPCYNSRLSTPLSLKLRESHYKHHQPNKPGYVSRIPSNNQNTKQVMEKSCNIVSFDPRIEPFLWTRQYSCPSRPEQQVGQFNTEDSSIPAPNMKSASKPSNVAQKPRTQSLKTTNILGLECIPGTSLFRIAQKEMPERNPAVVKKLAASGSRFPPLCQSQKEGKSSVGGNTGVASLHGSPIRTLSSKKKDPVSVLELSSTIQMLRGL
eukprot:Gb_32860 [translate_table: standard]